MSRKRSERRTAERRKKGISVVLRERRTGFDRRNSRFSPFQRRYLALLVALRDNPVWLLAMLAVVNLLNVLDLFFTIRALVSGEVEVNPLLRVLFAENVYVAAFFKAVLILGVSLLIFRLRRFRLVLEAGVLAAVVFLAVFVYQILGAVRVLG